MSPKNIERNLLAGFLAMQMSFVSREQFLTAMSAWITDKSQSLVDIFVSQQALQADVRQLLEALVTKHLEQHAGDPQQSLAALSSIGSVRAELLNLHDDDLQASLAQVSLGVPHTSAPPADPLATVSVGQSTSESTRFRILRPHARGGLGEVSVAFDNELQREVALKEIQQRHVHHTDSRSRFLLEAHITGGLEHPGIVPIYGMGTYADGRPYYAMRFIRGDSLADGIRTFFGKYGPTESAIATDETQAVPTPGKSPPVPKLPAAAYNSYEFRQLLKRFFDVCNAIAYAHTRGVLHRDLKPGNIMLGKYGETLVVDWGLAKATGEAEASVEESQLPLSASGSSVAKTQMGSAIGTPGYMSPEQATGRVDQFGPATDVFGLGATLYHILTGRPPYEDSNEGNLFQRIKAASYASPRDINRAIPVALYAICIRAMAKETSKRYSSALDLAADIERWLADESVLACQESVSVRSRRWIRKHPKSMGFLAASFTLGLVTSIAISMVLSNSNRSLQQAQLTESRLRKQAESAVERAAERQYANLLRLAQVQWADGQTELANQTLSQCDWTLRGLEHDLLYTQFNPPRSVLVCENEDIFPPQEYKARMRRSWGDFHASVFSSDGSLVAAGGRQFDCWTKSGEEEQEFSAHPVVVWDRTKQKINHILRGHQDFVTKVAFSTRGRFLASGDKAGTVFIWDLRSGDAVKQLHHDGLINSLIFAASDRQLIVCDKHSIKWWDVEMGVCVRESSKQYSTIALSADERLIAAGSRASGADWGITFGIEILDVETDTVSQTILGHDQPISSIRFHKDGRRIFTAAGGAEATILGDYDIQPRSIIPSWHEIAVWDLETGNRVGRFQFHEDQIRAMALSPDGELLATGSDDETVRLWDVDTEKLIRVLPIGEEVSSLSFSQDGREVLVNTNIWKTSDRRLVFQDRLHRGIHGLIVDNSHVIARIGDDVVSWNEVDRSPVDSFPGLEPLKGTISFRVGYTAFDYSPKAKLVALGRPVSTDYDFSNSAPRRQFPSSVQISRFPTGEVIRKLQLERGGVSDLKFSPDGQLLAVGVYERELDLSVSIYSRKSTDPIAILKGISPTEVAWSPNGNRLLCLSSQHDARIQLWEPHNSKLIWKQINGYSREAVTQWSPNGDQFAVCDRDLVSLHSAETGEVVTRMTDTTGAGYHIEFTPDGSRLMTGSHDGTIKMWNAVSGEKTLEIPISISNVIYFALTPDGKTLYFADSADHVVPDSVVVNSWDAHQSHLFDLKAAKELNSRLRRMLGPVNQGYSLPDLVRQAEFLMDHYDTAEHATTLGIAYYRNGAYQDAVQMLSIPDRHYYQGFGYLAMSYHQLGKHREAYRYFAQMKEAMKGVRREGMFNPKLDASGAAPMPGDFPLYDEVCELLEE